MSEKENNEPVPTNNMEDLIEFMKKALDKITSHLSTKEAQAMAERRRWKKPNLYKTEICDHWRNRRKCTFGLKCWYAHGPQELRPNSNCSSALSSVASGHSNDDASSPMPFNGDGGFISCIEGPPVRSAITADVYSPKMELVPFYSSGMANGMPATAIGDPSGGATMQFVQQPVRPTFFLSFDNPYAGAASAHMPANSTASPLSDTTQTTNKFCEGTPSPVGFDFFRASNLNFNFASSSSALNLGVSGFGLPNAGAPAAATPSAAFASSNNWLGTLASSFVIPSKSAWMR